MPLGLLAATGYGIADYLARIAGQAVGVWRIMFYGNLVSLALLSLWIAATHGASLPSLFSSPAALCAAIAAGIVLLIAATLLTQGLIKGTVAVVAPVAASYGAVTTVLSVAAGERLTERVLIGLTITVSGVCLVSVPSQARRQFREHLHASGLSLAIGAAGCYGVGFWLQGRFAVPALGPLIPVWLSYAVSIIALPAFTLATKRSLTIPHRGAALLTVMASGVFGVGAYVALTLGLSTGRVAVVVVLSTLASAVTVMLSRIVEKAHVARHQWVAIAVTLLGLALIRGES